MAKKMPFSVKPFYDMVHSNSYIRPTRVTINMSPNSPMDETKSDIVRRDQTSPSASTQDEINFVHGDGKSFELKIAKCYADYLFALKLPYRVGILLPSSDIMATFICNGKIHKVKFFGTRKIKMFGSGWRQFVEKHNLVEGDRLKFKIKESSDKKLKLKVYILKCTVSSQLHEDRRGTSECPIDV